MIKANLNGLQNVLTAAAKEPKVRRIIHLSSVAAIFQHDADFTVDTEGVVYDETCFQSDEYMAHLRQKGNTLPGYAYSEPVVWPQKTPADSQIGQKSRANVSSLTGGQRIVTYLTW